jgi:hypothetical protein
MTIHSRSKRALAVLICLLVSAPELLFARFQPTSGSDMFTVEQEIQAGKEVAA